MPGDRHDESRSSRVINPSDRNLPPIREVLRDELDRPAQPTGGPYSFGEVQRALLSSGPPDQWGQWVGYPRYSGVGRLETPHSMHSYGSQSSQGVTSTRSRSAQGFHPSTPSSQDYHTSHSQGPARRGHDPEEKGYSYGVLRTSGTSGTLTDATPPSGRPQGILRQTSAPVPEAEEDFNKRYRCDYCGKRFGMPSHLQIHLRTHTAQRPFACEWPGCDRTFSVRSNMLRHFRSHEKATTSRQKQPPQSKYDDDDDDDDIHGEQIEAGPSSHYFHTGSSSVNHSSSQYYTSSRAR